MKFHGIHVKVLYYTIKLVYKHIKMFNPTIQQKKNYKDEQQN